MKPIVAVLGRPNVGKSTFFNRITRSRDALVDNVPGVTRDRLYRTAAWEGTEFTLIDTGGFLENDDDPFAADIRAQIEMAIEDADAIIMMFDGKCGVSPFDADLTGILRKVTKPVFYVVNKIDGMEQENALLEFHALGIDTLWPVSAAHGYGVPDFLDELVGELPPSEPEPHDDIIRIAVVGRPNAGKSSLINKILGENRLVVSETPGTTRDSVDSIYTVDGKKYCLVDTAGIRRKGKVSQKIEKFSIIKALQALDRCDVALVVMDAAEGISDQDMTVAGYAHDRGCGCILLLNKWDLVEKDTGTVKRYYEELSMRAKFLSFAPPLTISALTGQRVPKIFKLVDEVYEQYASRIGTGKLNRVLEQAVTKTEPPMHNGTRLKFYYVTQTSTKPPTFVAFVNFPDGVHFSYQRYLVNQFREGAGLTHTPIRLILRQRSGRIEFGTKKESQNRKSSWKERRRDNGKDKRRSNRKDVRKTSRRPPKR